MEFISQEEGIACFEMLEEIAEKPGVTVDRLDRVRPALESIGWCWIGGPGPVADNRFSMELRAEGRDLFLNLNQEEVMTALAMCVTLSGVKVEA